MKNKDFKIIAIVEIAIALVSIVLGLIINNIFYFGFGFGILVCSLTFLVDDFIIKKTTPL